MVIQVDYPLTNIRLIISGQCYECNIKLQFLSPPVQVARWDHMHYFLSVCLYSVCTGPKMGENISYNRKWLINRQRTCAVDR